MRPFLFCLPKGGVAAAFCAAVLAIGGAAPAGDAVSKADATAISGVITAQIDAYRRDDAEAAYRVASSRIEAEFGSPADFLAMVASAYPAVYRAGHVNFGPVVRVRGATIQPVGVVAPGGGRDMALYTMERDAGGWRIDGCVLTTEAGLSI